MTPTTMIWLQVAGILALEVSLLAIFGALLDRPTQSAAWRRTLWQACLVATIALLGMELGGFARAFSPGSFNGIAWRKRPAYQSRIHGANRLEQPHVAPAESSGPIKMIRERHLGDDFQSLEMARALNQPVSAKVPAPFELTSQISAPPPAINRERTSGDMAIVGLGLLWVTGFAAVLGRALFGRMLFVALRWRWPVVAEGQLQERAQILARSIGMRRRVRLIESPRLACPVAFGSFRPTIGLPASFAKDFERSEQDAVLLHELAHLRAGDPLWRVFADLATALLWWHPLVWWMCNRLEAASETAADEASALLSNGPGLLAQCLVRLGAQLARKEPHRTPGIAVLGFRSNLGRRVERLVQLRGRVWTPPCGRRSALARLAGSFVLALATILCTASVVPAALTKGENMQTMQHTWKRSLAAFGLLAALGTPNHAASAAQPNEPASTPANSPADSTADWTRAVAAFDATFAGVTNTQFAAARTSDATTAEESNAPLENHTSRTAGGTFSPNNAKLPAELNSGSKEKQQVEAKLKRIKLDTVAYNGVTLSEVVRDLGDTTSRLDPEKVGINFLVRLETQPSPAVTPGAIDPTTGLPVASSPAEAVDLNSVTVRIEPPLKQVRLCDVLDAITKVADHPIKYTVEDYGVVFSLDQSKISGSSFSMPAPELLYVQTFKVDTNTFLAGLDATFGIRVAQSGGPAGPHNIQGALHELLVKLGVNIDTQNKSIFYNQLTGILMVRGTQEDLSLVQAAIETLGGTLFSNAHGPPGPGATGGIGARP